MKKLIIRSKVKERDRPYIEVTPEVHRWLAELSARTRRPRREIVDEIFCYARENMELQD